MENKTTKEMLLKENARLSEKLEVELRKDKEIRTQLSKILRYENGGGLYSRVEEPMSWIQIAFHTGELRADANYSCLIEARENDRRIISELQEKLTPNKQ